jgi:hypothetical protein
MAKLLAARCLVSRRMATVTKKYGLNHTVLSKLLWTYQHMASPVLGGDVVLMTGCLKTPDTEWGFWRNAFNHHDTPDPSFLHALCELGFPQQDWKVMEHMLVVEFVSCCAEVLHYQTQ